MITKEDSINAMRILFSIPCAEEIKREYNRIRDLCITRFNSRFSGNDKLYGQLLAELEMIRDTGTAMTLRLLMEISKMSEEEGYPVMLMGRESGLLIMYLLGISQIHPKQYLFSTTPSEFCLESVRVTGPPSFELAIAHTVAEKLEEKMSERMKNISSEGTPYIRITLPLLTVLEEIGNMAFLSGMKYKSIDMNNRTLLRKVQLAVCKEQLQWKELPSPPDSIMDVAAYYAFTKCSSGEKTKGLYEKLGKYVFRDQIYEELVRSGMSSREAFLMSGIRGSRYHEYRAALETYPVPGALHHVFRSLENPWASASCLSRLMIYMMRKWYQGNNNQHPFAK